MDEPNKYKNINRVSADGLVKQNIVLMSGLLTGPVIAGAVNFENAAVIALAFSFITLVTVSICRLIPRKIVYTVRIIIYALAASLVYIPVHFLLESLMGTQAVFNTGVYLPVLITNPVILSKTETRFYHRSYKLMLPELIGYIIGFDVVCLLAGFIRDVLVSSHVGWLNFNLGFTVPALETSFGGFILVGIMAGLCRAFYNKYKNSKEKSGI